jgi:preprotein translocase subunit SecE
MKILEKIKNFFKEVPQEMKMVTWLSNKEIMEKMAIVVIVWLLLALYLGGLDFILSFLRNTFLLK